MGVAGTAAVTEIPVTYIWAGICSPMNSRTVEVPVAVTVNVRWLHVLAAALMIVPPGTAAPFHRTWSSDPELAFKPAS